MAAMNGWFAVKRGITSHHIFKGNPERLAVWMWLLDNAAWKDTKHDVKGKTVTVPRGSVCASERHISRECGVGYQVVRTSIKRLKDEHMINADPTHGKNLISLCNYEKYQDADAARNAKPNAAPTQHQRSVNAQKEQGNKGTSKDSNESLVREVLESLVSQPVALDFIAHRKAMKKPITERAARAMLTKLRGHPDPDAVLLDSIANGWQGIFPEKTQLKPQTQKTERPNGQELAERAAARFRAMDSGESADTSQPLLPARHTDRRGGGGFGRLDKSSDGIFSGTD